VFAQCVDLETKILFLRTDPCISDEPGIRRGEHHGIDLSLPPGLELRFRCVW
jgi:hypothetical protein